MISINFNIRNPFSSRWDTIFSLEKLVAKHKSLEIQLSKDNSILGFGFTLTFRQSHAGLMIDVSLLGYNFIIHYCDTRHWDYENNKWCVYE